MNYQMKMHQVHDTVVRLRYLETMDNIMYGDKWYTCPKRGFDYETKVNAYLAELRHQQIANLKVRRLVEAFEDEKAFHFENDLDRGMVRYLKRQYAEAVAIPAELGAALNEANSVGQQAWESCYKANDFKAFKPYLKQQLEVQQRIAEAVDPNASPFQVLVNRVDREYRLAEIDAAFERIRTAVMDILRRRTERDIDPTVLKNDASRSDMELLVEKLRDILRFDREQSILYETRHPVCVCTGPRDSRPSLNYSELFHCLQAAAHEMGHGIYNYGSSDAAAEAGLWGGIDGAMHESQSRFFENHVFGSPEFWTAFYPEIQKVVPKYRDIPMEMVYSALNRVNIGPLRLQADELTNGLHIIIRYQLERDYFSGKLKLDDLEDAWNACYKEYLGVEPRSPQEGILQDVHWASGCYGYFQSYALGDIYASQFRHKLLEDHPNAWKKLERGDISEITGWLRENIHQYGQTYSARETLKKATGEDMNIQYYIDYLYQKFLPEGR